jgi:hypothetical protein
MPFAALISFERLAALPRTFSFEPALSELATHRRVF